MEPTKTTSKSIAPPIDKRMTKAPVDDDLLDALIAAGSAGMYALDTPSRLTQEYAERAVEHMSEKFPKGAPIFAGLGMGAELASDLIPFGAIAKAPKAVKVVSKGAKALFDALKTSMQSGKIPIGKIPKGLEGMPDDLIRKAIRLEEKHKENLLKVFKGEATEGNHYPNMDVGEMITEAKAYFNKFGTGNINPSTAKNADWGNYYIDNQRDILKWLRKNSL